MKKQSFKIFIAPGHLFYPALYTVLRLLVCPRHGHRYLPEMRPVLRPIPALDPSRILLVEDMAINREIVIAMLEDHRLEIDCAENGKEAVEKFSQNPGAYDLIFMDIQMPEVDGFEAARQIRACEAKPGNRAASRTPIIAMTANVFREDIEKCLQAGMDGHTGKHLDFEEVRMLLKKYLPKKDREAV
jgi:CheY-like chemotaxis protein